MRLSESLRNLGVCTTTSELSAACKSLEESVKDGDVDHRHIITILAKYLHNFEDATLFLKYLPEILLALVSERIPLESASSNGNNESGHKCHLENSIVLGILSDHPDVLQYALKYFEANRQPPFEATPEDASYSVLSKKRRLQGKKQDITPFHVVSCCHSLLKKLPNEFSLRWDWSSFIEKYSDSEDSEIRWMVKECMVILGNLTEVQSHILTENLRIHGDDELKFTIDRNLVHPQVSGPDLLVKESEILDVKTDSVVNINGVMLSVYSKDNVTNSSLVPVKSTVNNLRSVALAVASGKAVCLLGPVGSGKTSLVEHLASATGRQGIFRKVQLGDQTDSRMLLGTYHCTDVPGEFVWRPGLLTEAVQNGEWLLLEDIDSAALDVASTLSSLLERGALSVPGYRDCLPVAPGFQLFLTQRTVSTQFGYQKRMSGASALLQKHLAQINIEPLSRSEMAEIIRISYPQLSTISTRMIEVFMMFSVGSHDSSIQNTDLMANNENSTLAKGSRLISTRDLMKWCQRSIIDYDVTSQESALKVLQDAIDIFCSSVPSPESRLELSKKVGTKLGIVEMKSEFYLKSYKPSVSLNPSSLEVGRAKVSRKERSLDSIDFEKKQDVFSFTRPSACLLERIACCVMANEPVLLVGETGTGKTSSVQYLARQTGHNLVVINMNQQSDSADLLGGYKPVDLKYVILPVKNKFVELFKNIFVEDKNDKFLLHVENCYDKEQWSELLILMKRVHITATKRVKERKQMVMLSQLVLLGEKLDKLELQIKAALRLTFAFIEGSLVKAMQRGDWVLLDEINLASAEILECLAGLLEEKNQTIDLLEKGDRVPIKRHKDFTLFACMNPATDVGKKELPVGLRNRFTEFFVDELTEKNDLMQLVGDYLYHLNLSGATLEAIYTFYIGIKKEAKLSLVDGAGHSPHYSLRTLCRALTAASRSGCGTVARSLYEAFCLSFLTQLDSASHPRVEAMIARAVIGKRNLKSVLNQAIPEPQCKDQKYLNFEGHWIPQGKLEIAVPESYILTNAVRKNLRDIARIISLGKLPVLLQGDTSVGKTSLISYIAKASGNYCVRINNHEHTDLQEYIGSYNTDANGKLVFIEGVLVEAMRKGYWIILDELNLAPTDVLEALNRVLDDNRELFIPETQQVVKADPNFMLFATQNPPGLYGGRKMLSRAFRNRFVELHFDEIPRAELEIILHKRCHMPPSYCKKMIAVMAELQVRRRGSAAIQGKDGFITLRDLFRWGQRYKLAANDVASDKKFYDWDQHIADEGYLVLAGKVRQTDERSIIEEVIAKYIGRKVNPNNLFSLHEHTSPVTKSILEELLNSDLKGFDHLVWTFNMRRLAVLIAKSFIFTEPVLLVGETGCGKTTICQVLAAIKSNKLLSVNCHMHTESSDFLGGLRPVRHYQDDGKLFEWVDGPLVNAMENGNMFLADEISLADDSVLERLNSLLEPERQLVLAERGTVDNGEIRSITARDNFHFIGTMNPGGDFGKKELSPALRNRFTEIWCDSVTSKEDLLQVLERSVENGLSLGNQEDGTSGIGSSILKFTDFLKSSDVTNKFPFSIRDLLSWVNFINSTVNRGLLDVPEAYVHGACLTFLDCFGTALTGHVDPKSLATLRRYAIDFLMKQVDRVGDEIDNLKSLLVENKSIDAVLTETKFGIKPFYIEVGKERNDSGERFTFSAPTTGSNTLRLLRGLQLNKAVLLEGNPGVGKTSLVTALARVSGHKVVRINLSDQTDITDLFGTDLPTEDGSFEFKEGAFLKALQNGDWILLDELNLAPQPVLEGLNACLDHRGEIYIPELGKTFKVLENTRLFACQNPLKQGGARRGLPISFLNRFTQVYIDTLTAEDLKFIVDNQYSAILKDILHKIVEFNCRVSHEISYLQLWGHKGSPWEMNLRDIQRWCEAMIDDTKENLPIKPGKFVDMLYANRMRSIEDKNKMTDIYHEIFGSEYPLSDASPQFYVTDHIVHFGDVGIGRNPTRKHKAKLADNLFIVRNELPVLKALAQCVKMNWLSIVVGATGTGKSSIVQVLADITGNELKVVPVTSAMDVSDLLGGYEQVDFNKNLENQYDKTEALTLSIIQNMWLSGSSEIKKSSVLLKQMHKFKSLEHFLAKNYGKLDGIKKFEFKVAFLQRHCTNLLDLSHSESVKDAIENIKKELEKLKKKVNNSALNAGGKFEWIDSVLVKSMVEGSWLLMDNVNLTSAAVLDRLNGLLEPNGVLNIPERGEINEIRPHPEFRIFFTMDVKYGEISRAMRNRGVEIFILKHDDNLSLSKTVSSMDLAALLNSSGLPCEYHHIAIRAHEVMSDFVYGPEKPSITQLLQASNLISQQISRGVASYTAILNSFSDVYIKPRCGNEFTSNATQTLAEMKNIMLKSLDELLTNIDATEFKVHSPCHSLNVQSLLRNSKVEIAKQNVYPIIEQISNNKEPDYSKIISSIVIAYQKSDHREITIQNEIIKASLANILSPKGIHEELIDLASNALTRKERTMDSRFYPELTPDKDVSKANKTNVYLYHNLLKHVVKKSIVDANDGLSALQYSNAVITGKIQDFVEYPVLRYCQNYIEAIDKFIDSLLGTTSVTLNDVCACDFLLMLNWRTRFLKTCSMHIFVASKKNKLPVLKEELVSQLYVHLRWVYKHLLVKMSAMLPKSELVCRGFLRSIEVDFMTSKTSSYITKICKKIRSFAGQPNLYSSQEEYELKLALKELFKRLAINVDQSVKAQMPKLMTSRVVVQDIMNSNLDTLNDVSVQGVNELVLKVDSAKDVLGSEDSEIQLLPLKSYIAVRVLLLIKNEFSVIFARLKMAQSDGSQLVRKSESSIDNASVLQHLTESAKSIVGFPPHLLRLMLLLKKIINGEIECDALRLSSLQSEFWDEFYKATANSPAFIPAPFANISIANDDVTADSMTNNKKYSEHLPMLPLYVVNLTSDLTRHGLASETISLKESESCVSKLNCLSRLVWNNMATLDLAAVKKSVTDAMFEMRKYEDFICLLHCALNTTGKTSTLSQTTVEFNDDLLNSTIEMAAQKFDNKENFLQLLIASRESYIQLKSVTTPDSNQSMLNVLTAKLGLVSSFLIIKIMANVPNVDPVHKKQLKLAYTKDDIHSLEAILSAFYVQGVVTGTISNNAVWEPSDVEPEMYESAEDALKLKRVHSYCALLMAARQKAIEKIDKYAAGSTFRPSSSYLAFEKDCKHFESSILSSRTAEIVKDLLLTADLLRKSHEHNAQQNSTFNSDIANAKSRLKETESWAFSLRSFYKRFEVSYSEVYPDLAKPLLAASAQMMDSVEKMRGLIEGLLVKLENSGCVEQVARDLVEFPYCIPRSQEFLSRFMSSSVGSVVGGVMKDVKTTEAELFSLLRMNLGELQNYVSLTERIDDNVFITIRAVLDNLVKVWDKQQTEIALAKEEDEKLFVTKSKCDEDEEQQDLEEIKELFPSYVENDFVEFKGPTLEQNKALLKNDSKPKTDLMVKTEDVTFIYQWHSNFIQNITATEWLPVKKTKLSSNVAAPVLQRYPIFGKIVEHSIEAFDVDFEGVLSPSLLVLIDEVKKRLEGDASVKGDFYRSPNVSETKRCLPLLRQVSEETNVLLAQWPDFPTLKDITVIVGRIMGFPLTSPVPRYLTGLELLLDRLHEWNKAAHARNNLMEVSLEVGRQVVAWRRLEMGHWRESLNAVLHRKQAESHRFWFFIHAVVEAHLTENEQTKGELVEVFRCFVENSTLADFDIRLDILFTFHCHLVHVPQSKKRDELLAMLWNVHKFYSQFGQQVALALKEKRAPIEKKLKEFVKICKWDRDLSYWSVKATVEKAHKTLHKHMKEFEEVLKTPVSSHLTVDASAEPTVENVGIWDRRKRHGSSQSLAQGGSYLLDVLNYLALCRTLKKILDAAGERLEYVAESSVLQKVPRLFGRAKELCKGTLASTPYSAAVQALDDLVTQVIETASHLGSLEVDVTLPKEKQKSQAKSFLRQKQRALAELFSTLATVGLSYKTGLVLAATGQDLYDYTVRPVDLTVALSTFKSKRADKALTTLWSGCEAYYQKNAARHKHLTAALVCPHKDLGIQTFDRCKGYAAQLMNITLSQKKSIAECSRQFCELRHQLNDMTSLVEIESKVQTSYVIRKLEILLSCYGKASILLQQLQILLDSMPEKGTVFESNFDTVFSNSNITKCHKENGYWKELCDKVNAILLVVNRQKSAIKKLEAVNRHVTSSKTDVSVISQSHVDVSIETTKVLTDLQKKVEDLLNEYQFVLKPVHTIDYVPNHPVLRSLVDLNKFMQETVKSINDLDDLDVFMDEVDHRQTVDGFSSAAEDTVATLLLIMQNLSKKYKSLKTGASDTDTNDVINAIDDLINGDNEKHDEREDLDGIKSKIHDQLMSDVKSLQLEMILTKIGDLLKVYVQNCDEALSGGHLDLFSKLKAVLTRVVPILEQMTLFVQFFLTQQVSAHRVTCKMLSVLLKIFSDLAAKGFCKVEGLDADEGDGEEGPGKMSSGTGLGDGDGQKDVSDKIENQDQLDDAKKPGEQEKEEEKDCKEEEAGVNMSDDFDSHLQDVEKKNDDENDDQSDEDDDADKQMGETDKAADRLDQEIWGSDEESEAEEGDQEEKKEEKGSGESTGEKKMGAKEDKEDGKDDSKDGKEEKQKKDINELKEPEVDDDHVDPYHGKQQPLPEPEDFDLPDDMNIDEGHDNEQDQEGDTENENPFEIDKLNEQEENEDVEKDAEENNDGESEKDKNKHGLEVSSDEEEEIGENEENDKEPEGNPEENKEQKEENEGIENDEENEKIEDGQSKETEPEVADTDKEENPRNPDPMTDEDKENEDDKPGPQERQEAEASNNDPSAEDNVESSETQKGTDDNVQTNPEQPKDNGPETIEQKPEEAGEERQKQGAAQVDDADKGHSGQVQEAKRASQAPRAREKKTNYKNKPSEVQEERTLGEVNEQAKKKTQTLNVERDDATEEDGGKEQDGERESDLHQHVKQAKRDDIQVLDAATKEQAEQQPIVRPDDDEHAEELQPDEEVPMEVDDPDLEVEKAEKELQPEKVSEQSNKEKKGQKTDGGDEVSGETGIEVEGQVVATATVPRGGDTTFHTRLDVTDSLEEHDEMTPEQYLSIRDWLNSGGPQGAQAHEASGAWRHLWQSTGGQARDLSERLRLVLEPTTRSRLAGDYRSGRRINMRRVIPYIASQFRKDRIWLRRTRPARRRYHIALALDDSSSMGDNASKELAFESLALVTQALNLLESGELAVLSFGEQPAILHPFAEQFSEHSGANILGRLQFDQKKTRIAQLLDFAAAMFEQQTASSEAANAKLLVVVSDGRGVFSEGEARVRSSVRRARQAGVFLVYVIIDNPLNKDSIMDIRKPLMDPETQELKGFIPYLDAFPFPFYLVLRDLSQLPTVLGDALRQWFELAANTS